MQLVHGLQTQDKHISAAIEMTHKQFPALEFTHVNAKGTCRKYSLQSRQCEIALKDGNFALFLLIIIPSALLLPT